MPIGAGAALGASAIAAGGVAAAGAMQSGAIKDSAETATAESKRQFDIGQANQKPWLVTGTSALNKLGSMYGLDTYQPNWSGPGGVAQTPGMAAVAAYNPEGEHSSGGLADLAMGWGGGGNWLEGALGANNRSQLGDIWGAVQAGLPVDDASWAAIGFGPGGTALGSTPQTGLQQPVAGNTSQPNVAPGAASGTPGAATTSAGTFTPGSAQPGVDPYADFYKSPDYQFRLTEGIKGLDASAAAGGSLDSGDTRKAAIGYAGNLAAGEFNTYAGRLMDLAGVGHSTAANTAQQGASYANNVGNIATDRGNALASSYGSTIGSLSGIGSGLIMNLPQSGGGGYVNSGPGWYGSAGSGLPGVYVTPRVPHAACWSAQNERLHR